MPLIISPDLMVVDDSGGDLTPAPAPAPVSTLAGFKAAEAKTTDTPAPTQTATEIADTPVATDTPSAPLTTAQLLAKAQANSW